MLPRDEPAQPFAEPWHAQLFATTHALASAGAFTWPEWAHHFGAALRKAGREGTADDGSAYYDIWLAAFEDFLIQRRLADTDTLDGLSEAWTKAYLTTPHGSPVAIAKVTDQ